MPQETKELILSVRSLVRFLAFVVLLVAVVVAINSVVMSHINDSVAQQGENINGNTENIQQFGAEVRATKRTLDKAVAEVQDNADNPSEFTQRVEKGLVQIDKLCEQTNCEG